MFFNTKKALPPDDAMPENLRSSDPSIAVGAERPRTGAIIALVAAILLWGANWPVMKVGLGHITPLWFSGLRFATGAACLFAFQAARGDLRAPTRRDWPFVLSIGVFQMMIFTALGAIAMTQLPAGRSAILSYTTTLWVVPASILLFGERVAPRRLAGIGLGVLGVAILVNPAAVDWTNGEVLEANFMLLAASFCWAICILHLRYFRSSSSPFQLAPWQMLFAAVWLVIIAAFVEGPFTGDGTPIFWGSLIFVGPLATAFCFCAVNAASVWLPASAMSTVMLGVPVTGVALSLVTLGEPLTFALALGSLAIVAGIAVSAIPNRSSTP